MDRFRLNLLVLKMFLLQLEIFKKTKNKQQT